MNNKEKIQNKILNQIEKLNNKPKARKILEEFEKLPKKVKSYCAGCGKEMEVESEIITQLNGVIRYEIGSLTNSTCSDKCLNKLLIIKNGKFINKCNSLYLKRIKEINIIKSI
jgi:hypothetical protein